MKSSNLYDFIGVGIGPSNLSIASLIAPLPKVKACFLEQKAGFVWHPGMLMKEATIQVSFLKDLVSLVDPTNPYSFLSFLVQKKRIYRYLNAQFKQTKRLEFNQYYQWVTTQLPNLHFNQKVNRIDASKGCFYVSSNSKKLKTSRIVLATGLTAKMPDCAQEFIGEENVFHAINFLAYEKGWKGKKVAVIGGGQSGAEVVNHILADNVPPDEISWITGRPSFLPIDDSNFTNEFFTPDYSVYFQGLPSKEKARIVREQNIWSDGIEPGLLSQIYQSAYEMEFLTEGKKRLKLVPEVMVSDIEKTHSGYSIVGECVRSQKNIIEADIIILATGFTYKMPDFMEPLKEHIVLEDGRFVINEDFSIQLKGLPETQKIYVQNVARFQRGIADPNLSLTAWRSAKIINSILGVPYYDLKYNNSIFDWNNSYKEIAHEVFDPIKV